jgi:hypothetical protein
MRLPDDPDPQAKDRHYSIHRLYSELQIAFGTFLGGPIAGFIMLQRNFLELREFRKAQTALAFGIIAILVWYPLLYWLSYRFYGLSLPAYAKIVPPALVETVFILHQRSSLSRFLSGGAGRASFLTLLKCASAGFILEAAFLTSAHFLLPNMRGEKVTVGSARHELYFRGMGEAEARSLAGTLESLGHLAGQRRNFMLAEREPERIRLLFPSVESAWDDLENLAYHTMLLDDLGRMGHRNALGCFFHEPYGMRDTVCFGAASVPLLARIRDRNIGGKLDILARVRAEIAFFQALFDEAQHKGKSAVTWSRVPTLFVFASNGIGTVPSDRIPEAVAESYGTFENAEQGIRILAYAFQGLEWRSGEDHLAQHVRLLGELEVNLGKLEDFWKEP